MATTATESKFCVDAGHRPNERIVIGVDEAGYGPNLGPLIIAGTAWRVPVDMTESDLTTAMATGFSAAPWKEHCTHVPLGDSKQLYSPASGLRTLETGLLAMLCQLPHIRALFDVAALPATQGCFETFLEKIVDCGERLILATSPMQSASDQDHKDLQKSSRSDWRRFDWYQKLPNGLPEFAPAEEVQRLAELAKQKMADCGIELVAAKALVVDEATFNRQVDRLGSKGRLLSTMTMQLVSQLVDPWAEHAIEIFCDRQGGRKKYACVLLESMPDDWFEPLQELDERSSYRRQREPELRVHFSVGGDSFPPTSLASMIAKYLRERLMTSINQYWAGHLPGLKATAGYPQDARRYRAQIEAIARQLSHDPQDWWRVC